MAAKQEFDSFLAKYSEEIEALTRAAVAWIQRARDRIRKQREERRFVAPLLAEFL
jgi:hypothetical protein